MVSVPTVLRWLWRGARAVRAVQRTQTFVRNVFRASRDLHDRLDLAEMDEDEAAEAMEGNVAFDGQERMPTKRDFLEGPDETRAEHLASTRQFQRRR